VTIVTNAWKDKFFPRSETEIFRGYSKINVDCWNITSN